MTPRAVAFVAVSAGGFVVQLVLLTALTSMVHWPVPLATAIAVEAAVLTNFWCHQRWTWRDRSDGEARLPRLARFHVSNGATSLVGNVVLTSLGVSVLGFAPATANTLAVGLLGALNYTAADRWVFARRAGVAAAIMALAPTRATAADLQRETVAAWDWHTAHTVRFDRALPSRATSRSIATRIDEAGGNDHGFLWRLNSYWRYRQVGDSVQVDLLSVSLSRGVPAILGRIAMPIASRVARESMQRTLEAVKRLGESLPAEGAGSVVRTAAR